MEINLAIIVGMPIYEYRCEACGKRSSTLLGSYSSPDPSCPHCGKPALRRLVSTFATTGSTEVEGDSDFGGGGDDDFGGSGGDDFGGGGDDDFGGGDDDF
jgi:putative FmdB family regulatory protein